MDKLREMAKAGKVGACHRPTALAPAPTLPVSLAHADPCTFTHSPSLVLLAVWHARVSANRVQICVRCARTAPAFPADLYLLPHPACLGKGGT